MTNQFQFKLVNYDGGLPFSPKPRGKGKLILRADGKWELQFPPESFEVAGRCCWGSFSRYPLSVTSTGPLSCRVTINDRADPGLAASFQLPSTSAAQLLEAITLRPPGNAHDNAEAAVQVAQGAPDAPRQKAGIWTEHKANREAEKYQRALAEWEVEQQSYVSMVQFVRNFRGFETSEILLGPGELAICKVDSASLIQDVRGRGHFEAKSAGLSVPVASVRGRSVRFRVGATRGHFAAAPAVATAVDTGRLWITNKRVLFQGSKQTRECAFAKLIGYEQSDADGSATFSVTNRQQPMTVLYGSDLAAWFDLRLELALALFRGTTDQLLIQLQSDLAAVEGRRPTASVTASAICTPPSAPEPQLLSEQIPSSPSARNQSVKLSASSQQWVELRRDLLDDMWSTNRSAAAGILQTLPGELKLAATSNRPDLEAALIEVRTSAQSLLALPVRFDAMSPGDWIQLQEAELRLDQAMLTARHIGLGIAMGRKRNRRTQALLTEAVRHYSTSVEDLKSNIDDIRSMFELTFTSSPPISPSPATADSLANRSSPDVTSSSPPANSAGSLRSAGEGQAATSYPSAEEWMELRPAVVKSVDSNTKAVDGLLKETEQLLRSADAAETPHLAAELNGVKTAALEFLSIPVTVDSFTPAQWIELLESASRTWQAITEVRRLLLQMAVERSQQDRTVVLEENVAKGQRAVDATEKYLKLLRSQFRLEKSSSQPSSVSSSTRSFEGRSVADQAAMRANTSQELPSSTERPVLMSPDGKAWWDGNAWQDADLRVPPEAVRSPDGTQWWDTARWRPLPT